MKIEATICLGDDRRVLSNVQVLYFEKARSEHDNQSNSTKKSHAPDSSYYNTLYQSPGSWEVLNVFKSSQKTPNCVETISREATTAASSRAIGVASSQTLLLKGAVVGLSDSRKEESLRIRTRISRPKYSSEDYS